MCNISVIIPAYNAEKYIVRCLDSLLPQITSNDEIIIVDDGSNDTTYDICTQLKKQNRNIEIYRQENAGSGAARNCGLGKAKKDWVIFVDADDFVEQDFLANIRKFSRKDTDIIFFEYIKEDGKKNEVRRNYVPNVYSYDTTARYRFIECAFLSKQLERNTQNNMCAIWAKAYRTSFLEKNNLRFPNGITVGEDLLFLLKVYSCVEQVKFVTQPAYHYYFYNEGSITNRYKPDMMTDILKFDTTIKQWLEQCQEYKALYSAYRLNDIIILMKYTWFHPENKDSYSRKVQKAIEMIKKGKYKHHYQVAVGSKIIKKYGLIKRVIFKLAVNDNIGALFMFYKMRYK